MKDVNNELMNKKIDEEEQIENERSNKFNLIIGVSTLLIAILGATFAYFSATARSEEGDVNVKSAYVSISYDGGTEIKATNLIPASETVAINKFTKEVDSLTTIDDTENPNLISEEEQDKYKNEELADRRCIDANGREVCYVYQFTINSDGEAGRSTALTGYITVDSNEFDNLSYIVYEVSFKKNPSGVDLIDRFGDRVVDTFTVVSEFRNTENLPGITNDFSEVKFATFTKPFDLKGDNGEVIRTVYPVECLFGYSEDYDSLDADNPARCKNYSLTNQESHTYQVMIWLEETGNVQPEQGLTFSGTVSLEVPGGQDASEDERITGKD